MNFDAAALWTILKKNLYCPETELFYDYRTSADPAERFALLPTAEEIGVDFPNPCGWGTGMEDCSLNGGLALELCRIYEPDCGFASRLVSGWNAAPISTAGPGSPPAAFPSGRRCAVTAIPRATN